MATGGEEFTSIEQTIPSVLRTLVRTLPSIVTAFHLECILCLSLSLERGIEGLPLTTHCRVFSGRIEVKKARDEPGMCHALRSYFSIYV